jgi:hypothetical protein
LGTLRPSAFAAFTTATTSTAATLTTLTTTRTKSLSHLLEFLFVNCSITILIGKFNEPLTFRRKLVFRDLTVFVLVHGQHAFDERRAATGTTTPAFGTTASAGCTTTSTFTASAFGTTTSAFAAT